MAMIAAPFTGDRSKVQDLGGGTYLDTATGNYYTGTWDNAINWGTDRSKVGHDTSAPTGGGTNPGGTYTPPAGSGTGSAFTGDRSKIQDLGGGIYLDTATGNYYTGTWDHAINWGKDRSRIGQTAPTPTGGTTPSGPGSMHWADALAQVNRAAGRQLSQAEIYQLLAKYGGAVGSDVTTAGLAPVLQDVATWGKTGGPRVTGAPRPGGGTGPYTDDYYATLPGWRSTATGGGTGGGPTETERSPYPPSDPRSQINAAFFRFTGRNGTEQELNQWGTNLSSNYVSQIANAIANTDEAKAYAARGGTQTPGEGGGGQDDTASASQFFSAFIAKNHLESWGDATDGVRAYQQLRQQGASHEDAIRGALQTLGWDKAGQQGGGSGGPTVGRPPNGANAAQLRAYVVDYARTHPNANPSVGADPDYWVSRILQTHPNGQVDWGYWESRFDTPEGPPEGAQGPPAGPTGPAQPTAPTTPNHGYDDPNAAEYLNEVTNRINQLKNPIKDPFEDILKLFSLMRVGDLSGDPFTAGEDAALTAKYRDPLTQARDTAKSQKALELSRRGIGPESGLFHSEMGKIDQAYERGIATGANDLGVRAVTEKQRRADEQLSILSNLLNVNRSGVDRQNAAYDQVVELAKRFPDFDMSRLQALLAASGNGSDTSSALNSLTSLGSLNLNGLNLSRLFQNDKNANDAGSAAMWGQILGALFGNL